nr:ribonuclease H-like domain, reverse transcriptase, RNA-dependent DNA polymerase [Tanacetum cinerariifolium]
MSSMGELTFFLGLQVKQKKDGIFISQDKYVAKILKKFDFLSVKIASTPIETQKPLVKDEEATDVDVHLYWSKIGSLKYSTASRPDIMFAVYACSRFQVTPMTSHLQAVKRIFRFNFLVLNISNELDIDVINSPPILIKELVSPKQTALGKDISNSFMAGSLTKTICYKLMLFSLTKDDAVNLMQLDSGFLHAQFIQYALMVNPTIYVSCIKQFWATALIKKANDVFKLQALIDRKKMVVTERTAWNEFSCSMTSAVICLATDPITTPLQDQPAPPSSPPQEQPTDTYESSMNPLNTLIEICATLSQKVAQLEQDKIAQELEIHKLKKRVKKLEKKRR